MKSLKHASIFLIAVTLFLVTSCGSDSNGTGPSDGDEDRIVGTWNMVSLVLSSEGEEVDLMELSDCLEGTLAFEANGNFHSSSTEELFTDSESPECTPSTETGTWELESGTTYTVHTEEESETMEATFFNNDNSFSFTVRDSFEGSEEEVSSILTFDRQ